MNTISAADMRRVLAQLDRFKDLTGLLQHVHYDVPAGLVYNAISAEAYIRATLMRACVSDVAVETVEQAGSVAAPDLLAALKSARDFALAAIQADVDVPDFDPEEHWLIEKIDAAIGKAESV